MTNEIEKINQKGTSAVDKRRSFLKKAGVTSLVLTLPSHSVWGAKACTVSGHMSGNASAAGGYEKQCEIKGKSPWDWKMQIGSQGLYNPKWSDIFYYEPFYSPFDKNYLHATFSEILHDLNYQNEFNSLLIAAFYNAHFGFYPLDGITARQYVNSLAEEAHKGPLARLQIAEALIATWS